MPFHAGRKVKKRARIYLVNPNWGHLTSPLQTVKVIKDSAERSARKAAEHRDSASPAAERKMEDSLELRCEGGH